MLTERHHPSIHDRFVTVVGSLVIGTIFGSFLAGSVLQFVLTLMCPPQTSDCRLQLIDPTEGLVTYFKVTLAIGVVLALPVLIYQALDLVAPGPTRAARRLLYLVLPSVYILFAMGASISVRLIIPVLFDEVSSPVPLCHTQGQARRGELTPPVLGPGPPSRPVAPALGSRA